MSSGSGAKRGGRSPNHWQPKKASASACTHSFLNEARLSALAICLFLGALKESPATGLRLLVPDDILIGLDMAIREEGQDEIAEPGRI